ncbi:MAG: hypothetical protein AMXMBFR82_51510 [Candidatus Hydrogenedentota bacterium]
MARDRAFKISLGVSILFHLSMVTLFSIYIWIPVRELEYYTFDLVDPVTHESVIRGPRNELQVPSIEEALNPVITEVPPELEALALSAPENLDPALPQISLPRLEVAELERLQVREEGLRIRSHFEQEGPQDPWARFGREVGRLQDALRQLTVFDAPEEEDASGLQPVSRPVEGLALYIDWMSAPEDRELIFSPPIDALWRLDPKTLTEPIAIMFKVNPAGQVIEVMTPIEDEDGVVASAGKALIKYQFAPMEGDIADDQYGTLLIAPDEGPSL